MKDRLREEPKKIYAMPDLEGFWCDEKQNDNDIEYTRSDLVHQPKHETVGHVCNEILSTQAVVTILPNHIGNLPYSRAVIFPEEVKRQYDKYIANHHGKPSSEQEK